MTIAYRMQMTQGTARSIAGCLVGTKGPGQANEHFLRFTLGGYHAENFQAGSKGLGESNFNSHFSTKCPEDL